jgi:hydroxyacylglutathione hydrolase
MNNIVAIPAFKDNYIWAVHSLDGKQIVIVDPGMSQPVLEYLHTENLTLHGILITHHHYDHSGGVLDLLKQFPQAKVYGPHNEIVTGVTNAMREKDSISFADFDLHLNVIDIPGHTLGHIAFFNESVLFCGDTLFSCGCGRVFEGTPAQMYNSLEKIKKTGKNTQVYCGHEYTLANIAFAEHVEPNNMALKKRRDEAKQLRQQNLPSLPVTLACEFETNPFLRCEEQTVIDAVEKHYKVKMLDPIMVFAHLREWKNKFTV